MKLKDGVVIKGLKIEMRPVLIAAERVWKEHGEELVVTSGLDGAHSAGSYHPFGYAVDLRTRYFGTGMVVQAVARELRAAITREAARLYGAERARGYQVVAKSDHIHVEFEGDKV